MGVVTVAFAPAAASAAPPRPAWRRECAGDRVAVPLPEGTVLAVLEAHVWGISLDCSVERRKGSSCLT